MSFLGTFPKQSHCWIPQVQTSDRMLTAHSFQWIYMLILLILESKKGIESSNNLDRNLFRIG